MTRRTLGKEASETQPPRNTPENGPVQPSEVERLVNEVVESRWFVDGHRSFSHIERKTFLVVS